MTSSSSSGGGGSSSGICCYQNISVSVQKKNTYLRAHEKSRPLQKQLLLAHQSEPRFRCARACVWVCVCVRNYSEVQLLMFSAGHTTALPIQR